MASSSITKILIAAAIAMMVAGPAAEAMTCGTVTSKLTPCVNYARGVGELPQACCTGIKELNDMASTTQARKEACSCLKTTANALAGKINFDIVAALPKTCGVNIPYKISPSTDCARVK